MDLNQSNSFVSKNKPRSIIKTCFIIAVFILFILAISAIILIKTGNYQKITSRIFKPFETPFPNLTNPKEVKFSWKYNGKTYTLNQTYYESVYDYYNQKPKGIFAGREEKSINDYLAINSKDTSIDDLISSLKKIADANNLTQDQFLEFSTDFVQYIPYDSQQALTDRIHPRYPYEVLYQNKGICSDKTLLMTMIIRKLNYGSAIFFYDKDQHMAAAVKCPSGYTNYDSGYCIVETTAPGNKIGIIPKIASSGQASIESYQTLQNGTSKTTYTQLSNPALLNETSGNIYQGIISTKNLIAQINSLSSQLSNMQSQITADQNTLNGLKQKLDYYEANNQISQYNSLVPQYNSLVSKLSAEISDYNSKVNQYNQLIKNY